MFVGSAALETHCQLQLGTGIMSFTEGSRRRPGRNPCSFHRYLSADLSDHAGLRSAKPWPSAVLGEGSRRTEAGMRPTSQSLSVPCHFQMGWLSVRPGTRGLRTRPERKPGEGLQDGRQWIIRQRSGRGQGFSPAGSATLCDCSLQDPRARMSTAVRRKSLQTAHLPGQAGHVCLQSNNASFDEGRRQLTQ